MIIRPEVPADLPSIAAVTAAAFAAVERSSQTESAIIEALRAAGALSVSLVAVDNEQVIGHVAASPVLIDAHPGRFYGLGPLSVLPERQGEGIGSVLLRSVLGYLVDAEVIVLLGEPDFYSRFGFAPVEGLVYPDVPPEYFLAHGNPHRRGVVSYHPAFFV
ncbi:MAG: N-acetyltransferase [Corynebacterium sp.]|uniref:GNAT family N-acetyltransferase n=1 Tax=Corynebacterium sp. TaxID=1720 RepID=UPI0026DEF028|nr:N-acetyltransferase [Corynebacterium sp.]MDO5668993.1 N-acetyltransferase [Corynebacterium sp.]